MKVLIIPILLALSGCSTGYPVQFVSNPPNAAIICSGKQFGYTPKTLYFGEENIRDNRLRYDCRAAWVSGASEVFPGEVNLTQYPNGVQATANRPSYADNAVVDNQAAMYGAQNNQGRGNYDPRQDEYKFVPNKTTTCNKIGGQTFCTTY